MLVLRECDLAIELQQAEAWSVPRLTAEYFLVASVTEVYPIRDGRAVAFRHTSLFRSGEMLWVLFLTAS